MGDVLADQAPLPGAPTPLAATATNRHGTRLAAGGPGGVAVFDGGSGAPLWAASGRIDLGEGGATQLAWAHPDFGQLLAVASCDGTLSICEERRGGGACGGGEWTRRGGPWVVPGGGGCHPPPLAWADPADGPRLAAGGGDGVVRVYAANALLAADVWELESEFAVGGPGGGGARVTALAWRPSGGEAAGRPSPPSSVAALPALLAAGDAAGRAGVWAYRPSLGAWAAAADLPAPQEGGAPCTALAWAPRLGRPAELLASACPAAIALHALAGPVESPTVRAVARLPAPGVSSKAGAPGNAGGGEEGVWSLEFDAFGTWLAASLSGAAASPSPDSAPPPPPPRVCLWRPTQAGVWELQGEVVAGPGGA